ncbi:MAG: hypothetical protein OEP48_06110 [Betaproteobacteria bacterium]|nr:hypothetical protein [Betaproteobacteria bacterium]
MDRFTARATLCPKLWLPASRNRPIFLAPQQPGRAAADQRGGESSCDERREQRHLSEGWLAMRRQHAPA